MTLLVHVHSQCGVLQPDDQEFIRSEIASQQENITSPQLATLLHNQAAMIASQAEIIRALADVNKTLTQQGNIECFVDCLDYRNNGGSFATSRTIMTLSQDGVCNQKAYCDMETDGGGWTVFQRHQSEAVLFNRSWDEYKNGFGDLSDSFWWGNEKLAHALNDGRQYELRIDLFDWEGEHRYAKYSHFYVAPEFDNYRLNISGYTGNTRADSFGSWVNGEQFSTIDRDNDRASDGNCAAYWGDGGFWYSSCGWFFPNGRYSRNSSVPVWWGLHWRDWHGSTYSLQAVSMAFRATD